MVQIIAVVSTLEMRALAGTELGQEQLRDAVCPFIAPQSCSFSWYKASLSLSHMYTGKEGSRYKKRREQVPLQLCVQRNTNADSVLPPERSK